MGEFQIGDRIAGYWTEDAYTAHREAGTVTEARDNGVLKVRCDDGTGNMFHHKQCRRLVKKKRREVWIAESDLNSADGDKWIQFGVNRALTCVNGDRLIKFREVKEK